MAHYAFLDKNNVVTEVITGIDETELIEGLDTETWYGNFRGQVCKRTSYNTLANAHSTGGTPFRGNYASINYIYDKVKDVFIAPKPFSSWVLDENTFIWKAPIAEPVDDAQYLWDEEAQLWKIQTTQQ